MVGFAFLFVLFFIFFIFSVFHALIEFPVSPHDLRKYMGLAIRHASFSSPISSLFSTSGSG